MNCQIDKDAQNLLTHFAGATSRIGKEAASVLAKHGADVILAVRNVKLGEEVCGEIHRETPAERLDVMRLYLNSLP